ncbi:hypothetical protein NMG60_11037255 [Bertholletia excelsa]
MGRRNRAFSREESTASGSLSDALLFTTMCIIGLPVDVHVRDGSVYSGIFHTACVEDDYGIILKKARLTKKGNCYVNVASGDVIETLVVQSEDLVQVVAKGVAPPANGITPCKVTGDYVGKIVDTVPSLECADMEAKLKHSDKNTVDRMQTNKTRKKPQIDNGTAPEGASTMVHCVGNALGVENGQSNGMCPAKKEEASITLVNGRQVEDGTSQGKKLDHKEKSDFQKKETIHEVQGLGSSFDNQLKAVEEIHIDIASKLLPNGASSEYSAASAVEQSDQCQGRHASEDSACSSAISSNLSTSRTSIVTGGTNLCISSSASQTGMVPPKSSISTSKEFKLNPSAKVFCPSFANRRSVTPPAAPAVANIGYLPDNIPGVPIASAQPDVEIGTYAPSSSPPLKLSPYGNLVAGNGINDSQFPQHIIGQMGNRTQPVRYAGQYNHSTQAGAGFMHLNSQNVMVGRLGQLVYVHPVSHDVNQGVAAFSQVSTHPLLTPHQSHHPKHQGNAMQLCVTPHSIPAGQQPFAVQNPIPLPQPAFPVIHPIPVPGYNGVFNAKFP